MDLLSPNILNEFRPLNSYAIIHTDNLICSVLKVFGTYNSAIILSDLTFKLSNTP